jgi:hypothetical protein
MIALEAEFWTSKIQDFDFDSLLPTLPAYPPGSYEDAELWLQRNRIKALIKNDSISSRLGAKIRWTFSTFPLLDLAVLDIPDFRHTVREITLRMKKIEHLTQLSLCPRITKLNLSHDVKSINLGQIHFSCPFLEELIVVGLSNYSGTLNDLSTLRSLTIRTDPGYFELPIDLIPLHSTSTLTYLDLYDFDTISPEAKQALFTFLSLTHLSLLPLTDDVCDAIAELPTKLTSFNCLGIYPDCDALPPKVIKMLSSESLSRLTTLKLHIGSDDWESAEAYKQYSYSVLQTITVALPSLEVFETQMCLEEDGCQMFGQWHGLKKLTVRLDSGGEVDPDERMAHITDCIRKVFDGWKEKPLISVSYECIWL